MLFRSILSLGSAILDSNSANGALAEGQTCIPSTPFGSEPSKL